LAGALAKSTLICIFKEWEYAFVTISKSNILYYSSWSLERYLKLDAFQKVKKGCLRRIVRNVHGVSVGGLLQLTSATEMSWQAPPARTGLGCSYVNRGDRRWDVITQRFVPCTLYSIVSSVISLSFSETIRCLFPSSSNEHTSPPPPPTPRARLG
jgi:hypothetical protein